jgi:excisionase family DNA binding protein
MGNDFGETTQIKAQYTIREAAQLLDISYSTANRYVASGRLRAQTVGDIYLIAHDDLTHFKQSLPGRPNQKRPREWHVSRQDNAFVVTTIEADLCTGVATADFAQELEKLKLSEEYVFPGTIARYIFSDNEMPRHVQFLFVWRQSVMPTTQAEMEAALAGLRAVLEGVLDWTHARYGTANVWMHT